MTFGIIVLLVALSISAVAAYYSIVGLTAIFAAAVIPIIIMGIVLELGKVTATVWLHMHWQRCNLQFKLYLIPAIVVLLLITSMGIFGFLSKSHLDQAVPAGDVAAKVALFDERIKSEQEAIQSQKDNIASAKTALTQLNAQVNELLGRTTDADGASRAVNIRKTQAKERKALQGEIKKAQTEIDVITGNISKLREDRAPVAAEVRKADAEVGPIKYIAALVYGDNPDANLLERAVRWVIILLVFVFDPLAIVLILAGEQTINWAREDKRKGKQETHKRRMQELEENHQELLNEAEFTRKMAELNRQGVIIPDDAPETLETPDEPTTDTVQQSDNIMAIHPYLSEPWGLTEASTLPAVDEPAVDEPAVEALTPEELAKKKKWDSRFDPPPIHPPPKPVIIPDLSIGALHNGVNTRADFGTVFTENPTKGDMFLRVDFLPSKLFKWNSKRWIEVDKEITNRFAYNEEYIKHLVEKLKSGEYELDMLSDIEQEQASRYLNEQLNK